MIRSILLLGLLWAVLLPAKAASVLEGKIWDIDAQSFVSRDQLFSQLPAGGWLLLGEQHDHPEHHRLQAEWIRILAAREQLGAVALEMADHSQQPYLDAALGLGDTMTAEPLHWQPGWPWALYSEVVSTALNHASIVIGADLTRDEQRQAYHEGAPEGDLGDSHAAFMRELLFDSHCGQLPRQSLDGMRQVQLARDQQMAARLQRHTEPRLTGVMLTGSIHARRDLGIARWMARTPVVSVLMIPADTGDAAEDYLPEPLGSQPSADYLVFTSILPERDYCAELTGYPEQAPDQKQD